MGFEFVPTDIHIRAVSFNCFIGISGTGQPHAVPKNNIQQTCSFVGPSNNSLIYFRDHGYYLACDQYGAIYGTKSSTSYGVNWNIVAVDKVHKAFKNVTTGKYLTLSQTPGDVCSFYKHCNYGGWKVTLGNGYYPYTGNFQNNDMSSCKTGYLTRAFLYSDLEKRSSSHGGIVITAETAYSCFTNNDMNDKTSGVQVDSCPSVRVPISIDKLSLDCYFHVTNETELSLWDSTLYGYQKKQGLHVYTHIMSISGTRGAMIHREVHDNEINYDWGNGVVLNSGRAEFVYLQFEGYLRGPVTGNVYFRTLSDDGIWFAVGGKTRISRWGAHEPTWDTSEAMRMNKDRYVPFTIHWFEFTGGAVCKLYWRYGLHDWHPVPREFFGQPDNGITKPSQDIIMPMDDFTTQNSIFGRANRAKLYPIPGLGINLAAVGGGMDFRVVNGPAECANGHKYTSLAVTRSTAAGNFLYPVHVFGESHTIIKLSTRDSNGTLKVYTSTGTATITEAPEWETHLPVGSRLWVYPAEKLSVPGESKKGQTVKSFNKSIIYTPMIPGGFRITNAGDRFSGTKQLAFIPENLLLKTQPPTGLGLCMPSRSLVDLKFTNSVTDAEKMGQEEYALVKLLGSTWLGYKNTPPVFDKVDLLYNLDVLSAGVATSNDYMHVKVNNIMLVGKPGKCGPCKVPKCIISKPGLHLVVLDPSGGLIKHGVYDTAVSGSDSLKFKRDLSGLVNDVTDDRLVIVTNEGDITRYLKQGAQEALEELGAVYIGNLIKHGSYLFVYKPKDRKILYEGSSANPLYFKSRCGIRCAAVFDPDYYKKSYPDVKGDPYKHWLEVGAKEGRSGSAKFSVADYPFLNPDVKSEDAKLIGFLGEATHQELLESEDPSKCIRSFRK